MRKATLSANPTLQGKQRFFVEGLSEANRIITRDNITMEISVAERPDKTVVPLGRINSGEFNITLDFGDDFARKEYLLWYEKCIDRGTSARQSASQIVRNLNIGQTNGSGVEGIQSDYKKTATLVFHRLYYGGSGPDSNLQPVIVKLIGCFPKSATIPDYDMDGEETCTLEMSISYDDLEIIS